MAFKQRRSILFIVFCIAMGNAAIAQISESIKTNEIVKQGGVTAGDSVTITGSILDSITGAFPGNDSAFVEIDSNVVFPDSEGTFLKRIVPRDYHSVRVVAKNHALFSQIIAEKEHKKNYFITCLLTGQIAVVKTSEKKTMERRSTSGPCWTISGCIVDSKHDLSIQSDSFKVMFDDSLIKITKKGSYQVSSCQGGNHIFKVDVPGYHEVI